MQHNIDNLTEWDCYSAEFKFSTHTHKKYDSNFYEWVVHTLTTLTV